MKKFFLAATFILLLSFGGFLVWRNISAEPPLEFVATDASANWRTYSNDRYGFHIKYPPDSGPNDSWSIHQFPDASIVTFENSASGFGLSITWYPDSDADFAQTQKELQQRGKVAKISGVDVRHLHETAANSHGRLRIDGFYFPGPSGAYQITVSNAFANFDKKLKGSGLLIPLAREMVGTFGTHEIKRTDYLTYKDSRYHFSFSYPAAWDILFSAGDGRVWSRKPGADYWLAFEVMPSTALPYEIERHGKSLKVEEKREHFAHKIVGQKYLDNPYEGQPKLPNTDYSDSIYEGYYFEKDGFVLRIHIFRIKGPRKPVDDLLDSLEL